MSEPTLWFKTVAVVFVVVSQLLVVLTLRRRINRISRLLAQTQSGEPKK